jgi:hypothetical protein
MPICKRSVKFPFSPSILKCIGQEPKYSKQQKKQNCEGTKEINLARLKTNTPTTEKTDL